MDRNEIALSKPSLASAVLLVASTSGGQNNHRYDLIREVVNAGMDDDCAVEFLALAVMPDEMLEETRRFIIVPSMTSYEAAEHRQNFFRFANDIFHTLPWGEACTIVSNAMTLSPVFHHMDCMVERVESLRVHGVDCSRELTEDEIVYGRGLLALMDSWPFLAPQSSLKFDSVEDSELASLVKDSSDRYPELVAFIRERSTVDVAILREMMESPSPAVRSGML